MFGTWLCMKFLRVTTITFEDIMSFGINHKKVRSEFHIPIKAIATTPYESMFCLKGAILTRNFLLYFEVFLIDIPPPNLLQHLLSMLSGQIDLWAKLGIIKD